MTHRLTTLFTLACLALPAQAQWSQQSPYPTGASLWAVEFVSTSTGFIAGYGKTLLKTTDGGQTWQDVSGTTGAFPEDPFYGLHFLNEQTGFVSGNNGVWRTADGGTTWQKVSTWGGSWYHVDFVSSTTGFVGANGALIRSTDGGATFQFMSGYPTCPVIYGMDFKDAQVGLAGGIIAGTTQEGIFKTTNGGQTWVRKFSEPANDVVWLDAQTALAAAGTEIYRTTDAGETWVPYGSTAPSGLQDLEVTDATTLVGVTEVGEIWRSTDGGRVWNVADEAYGKLGFWAVSFLEAAHGWVVGADGHLRASSDGGQTWAQISSGTGNDLYDVAMASSTLGIAVGLQGQYVRTTDGGAFWETGKLQVTGQTLFRDESLNAVTFLDDSFVVAAGNDGVVYKSDDGGATWESIGYPSLYEYLYIEDVVFLSRDEGWVFGPDLATPYNRTIWRTTDGGASWTLAKLDGGGWVGADFTDPDHGWAVTAGNRLIRTSDGGATWRDETLPTRIDPIIPTDIDFADNSTGWVSGWYGLVAKSTDGGDTWQYVNLNRPDLDFSNLDVVSPSEVWVSSYDGVAYHTTDGGATWTNETVSEWPYTLDAIDAVPGGGVWTAGYAGHILMREAGSPLSLDVELTITSGVPVPAAGGTVRYQLALTNTTAASQTTQYWVDVTQPTGAARTQGPFSATVAAGATFRRTLSQRLPARAAAGTYTLTGRVGTHPATVLDSDVATFEKLAGEAVTEAAARAEGLPAAFALEAPAPNPFRDRATLRYALPEAARVRLSVYDGLGRRVALLVDEEREAGYHTARFEAGDLPSGAYAVRFKAGPYAETRRLTMIR